MDEPPQAQCTHLGCVLQGAVLSTSAVKSQTGYASCNLFKTGMEFCIERIVIFTLEFNCVLPDLIHNPYGAKKLLRINWSQSFLVTDSQGQIFSKRFPAS